MPNVLSVLGLQKTLRWTFSKPEAINSAYTKMDQKSNRGLDFLFSPTKPFLAKTSI